MQVFYHTGRFLYRPANSLILFASFIGHLVISVIHSIRGHLQISWRNVLKIVFHSGITLLVPLMGIASLICMSLSMATYSLLSRFQLQAKSLAIAQDILTYDILPLLLGFILCGQFSLNLINTRLKIAKQQRSPEYVILNFILPIFLGTLFTAFILFFYTYFAFSISFYLTFHYILKLTTHDYIMQIARSLTLTELVYSIFKTLFYCMIVSLTAGFYYYQIATNFIGLRKAVSRILTRGFFWLIFTSFFIRYLNL